MILKPPWPAELDLNDPINTGLVGRWLFNEGGGNLVNDISGSRNHIDTFSGGATWGTGVGGRGLLCGYNNADYASAPDHPAHTDNPGTTLLVWASNAKDVIAGSGAEYMVTKASSFQLFWSNTEQIYAAVRIEASSKGAPTADSTQVKGTALSQYGFVHDNLTLTPIFNGVVYTASAAAAVGDIDNTANAVLFGGDGGNGSWDGIIYQAVLYARALTPSEIARLYREPNAGLKVVDRLPLIIGAMGGGGEPATFKPYWIPRRHQTIGAGVI